MLTRWTQHALISGSWTRGPDFCALRLARSQIVEYPQWKGAGSHDLECSLPKSEADDEPLHGNLTAAVEQRGWRLEEGSHMHKRRGSTCLAEQTQSCGPEEQMIC